MRSSRADARRDVRALVEALIMPLAAELEPSEEPSRYLEFLAHLFLTSPAQVGGDPAQAPGRRCARSGR